MKKYTTSKLSDPDIRHAKPREKKYKLPDGGGLYCEILSTGTKSWRYRYRIQGKEKTYTIGNYPDVGLSEARTLRDQAKAKVKTGIDPSQQKQIEKRSLKEDTFQAIAEKWIDTKKPPNGSESNYKRVKAYLMRDVYPILGNRDIASIEAPELIPVITNVADRGAIDAARRVKGWMQQVFDYALVYGKVSRNPARDINISLILPKTITKHHAYIKDPVRVGELLRAIDAYHGSLAVRAVLKLSPMVFLRPTELRIAEWVEIDFDKKIWAIPAKNRKLFQHIKNANRKEDEHIIPLTTQMLEVLQHLHQYTGRGVYIFPSSRSKSGHLSSNAVGRALNNMGFSSKEIVPHGFRGIASTFLNTMGHRDDAIEAQLSHKDTNKIRGAYNHADYMEERKAILQDWCNYLDSLREGATVIPINRRKA